MTVRFIPFAAHHLDLLELQPAQADHAGLVGPEYGASLAASGFALAAVEADGANGVRPDSVRVLGAAGLIPLWPGRASAWVLMGRARPQEWTAIVRRIRAVIASAHRSGVRRVEATVDADFAPGIRLLRDMLGFREECRLAAFSPVGRDHLQFVHFAGET